MADPVQMPNGAALDGIVGAKIMVSTGGDVVCLWSVSGNPMMIPAGISALHQWKFKPMIVNGNRLEYVGQVKVPVRSARN